jgi:hypothetical protein
MIATLAAHILKTEAKARHTSGTRSSVMTQQLLSRRRPIRSASLKFTDFMKCFSRFSLARDAES